MELTKVAALVVEAWDAARAVDCCPRCEYRIDEAVYTTYYNRRPDLHLAVEALRAALEARRAHASECT